MALTPVEIRHLTFGRRPLGYRRSTVDRTLGEVADSFEEVWRDRADLADRVEQLEGELARFRELESLLHTTLVSAERMAQELQQQARREADVILKEAHVEARAILRQAHEEHERLLGQVRRLKALLRSALETVEETGTPETPEKPQKPEQPSQPVDETGSWQDPDPGRWGAAA